MQQQMTNNENESTKNGTPTASCEMLLPAAAAWLAACVCSVSSMAVMRRVAIDATGARCPVRA